jgi:anaerobic selenocysteine-containing dehydrogenase
VWDPIAVSRMLDKLDFYVAIDFFLSARARHTNIVLPGSLHEEGEGVVTNTKGRVIKINKAVDCPGERRTILFAFIAWTLTGGTVDLALRLMLAAASVVLLVFGTDLRCSPDRWLV